MISPKPNVVEPVVEKTPPRELDIWESVMACHRLVLSQTAGISLMVVPTRVTAALANRIREEEEREGVVQEVMQNFHFLYYQLISIFNSRYCRWPGSSTPSSRRRSR